MYIEKGNNLCFFPGQSGTFSSLDVDEVVESPTYSLVAISLNKYELAKGALYLVQVRDLV